MTEFEELLYTGQVRQALAIAPDEYILELTKAVTLFDEDGLSDDVAKEIGKFALDWCPHEIIKSEVHITDDCFCIEHYVDLDVISIFDLNWNFSGAMVSNFDNMYYGTMMISFSSKLILDEIYESTRQLGIPYGELE